jgi:NAD-dependent deacetylase
MFDRLEDALDRAAELLQPARSVAVLTGAGVSAESGVPTFRASDGLWEGHRIEDVATPFAFQRDPQLVWQFYNLRRANVATVTPNPGHLALAKLEGRWDEDFTLVTQNVDGLHRAAGSRNVLEVHGSLYRTRCTGCDQVADRGLEPLGDMPTCPACSALLRPDIVWFHEPLPEDIWWAAMNAAQRRYGVAKREPGKVIEFNLTPTEASRLADVGVYGPSGQTLPRLCEKLGL